MSPARSQPSADHRIYLGDAIVEELRAAQLPLEPRQFEFWFAYKSGRNAALKVAADAITARNGALTGADIERLHETYLSPFRLGEQPDAAVTRLTGRVAGARARRSKARSVPRRCSARPSRPRRPS